MQETAVLKFEPRSCISKGSKHSLRDKGFLTGNISRKGKDSISVAIKKDIFRKSLNKFGRNAVFKLESSEGNTHTVMVKEIQVTPIINDYLHVDFQEVSLSEEVRAEVPINIIGVEFLDSKRLLSNRQIDILTVIGLPEAIPHVIDIDVSELNAGDNIKVSDLKFTDGVYTEVNPDQIVLSISESKVREAKVSADV